jgi:transposase InsO family protein
MSWKAFLRAHWDAIAAADFFTVEVLTLQGLTRYFVFFVIELKTRRVHIAGIVNQPYGGWMMQVGRNLLDAADGFLLGKKYLILDRDPVYTASLRRLLSDDGVEALRLPAKSRNLNAHAERFVRSIRDECLHHVVLLGEQHLRSVVREYVAHYHAERNHQGLGNQLIEAAPCGVHATTRSVVVRHQRLGGLLNYYEREAA